MKIINSLPFILFIMELIMNVTDNPQEEYNQLKSELKDLKAQMANVAGTIGTTGVKKAKGAVERADHMIKDRPIPSAMMALGAGFVLGMIVAK